MSRRTDRVSELLRHEISRLLTLQIKDPRLSGVISITRIATSPDLRTARVYLSVMGDAAAKQSALEGIRSAASFLRRELRPRLTLRHTPYLEFDLDESIEQGDHILGIMDTIRDTQPSQAPPVEDGHGNNHEDDYYVGPLTFPGSGH